MKCRICIWIYTYNIDVRKYEYVHVHGHPHVIRFYPRLKHSYLCSIAINVTEICTLSYHRYDIFQEQNHTHNSRTIMSLWLCFWSYGENDSAIEIFISQGLVRLMAWRHELSKRSRRSEISVVGSEIDICMYCIYIYILYKYSPWK